MTDSDQQKDKIKIAVVVREETAKTCIGKGCLKAFNHRDDAFARYRNVDVELAAFCTEGGPSSDPVENIRSRILKLKKTGVSVVHLSTCNRSKNPLYDEMVRLFSEAFEVVGYTHGPEERKQNKE